MNPTIASIRRTSLAALVVAAVVTAGAIAFHQFCQYRFYQTNEVIRSLGIAASAVAVIALAIALRYMRHHLPRVKELPTVAERLEAYRTFVRTYQLVLMGAAVIEGAIVVLSGNSIFILFSLLTLMLMFVKYPSHYTIKVDLGLTDEQIKALIPSENLDNLTGAASTEANGSADESTDNQ